MRVAKIMKCKREWKVTDDDPQAAVTACERTIKGADEKRLYSRKRKGGKGGLQCTSQQRKKRAPRSLGEKGKRNTDYQKITGDRITKIISDEWETEKKWYTLLGEGDWSKGTRQNGRVGPREYYKEKEVKGLGRTKSEVRLQESIELRAKRTF